MTEIRVPAEFVGGMVNQAGGGSVLRMIVVEAQTVGGTTV
jgi:hypothetical protein